MDVPVSHFVWGLQILALRAHEVLRGAEPRGSDKLRLVAEYRRPRSHASSRHRDGTDDYELLVLRPRGVTATAVRNIPLLRLT